MPFAKPCITVLNFCGCKLAIEYKQWKVFSLWRLFSGQKEARPLLTASRLLERRRIFQQNLVGHVKQHHKVRTTP